MKPWQNKLNLFLGGRKVKTTKAYKYIDEMPAAEECSGFESKNNKLLAHLKTATNTSNWVILGTLNKEARLMWVLLSGVMAFLFSASLSIGAHALTESILAPLNLFGEFEYFINKLIFSVLNVTSLMFIGGFSVFVPLKLFLMSLEVKKENFDIFDNLNSLKINSEVKNGLVKALDLPLSFSWWDKASAILNEHEEVEIPHPNHPVDERVDLCKNKSLQIMDRL